MGIKEGNEEKRKGLMCNYKSSRIGERELSKSSILRVSPNFQKYHVLKRHSEPEVE